MNPFTAADTVALVDLPGIMHRVFHGMNEPTCERVLERVAREVNALVWIRLYRIDYTRAILALEGKGATEDRRKILPGYKNGRGERAEELTKAFAAVEFFMEDRGLFTVSKPGAEADDVIATYARFVSQAGARGVVMSADKDLMQCVRMESVVMLDIGKNPHIVVCHEGCPEWVDAREENTREVFSVWGVPPERILDVQALAGDPTDNIPGAPGVGLKTASKLVKMFGEFENVLLLADQIDRISLRETLMSAAVQDDVIRSAAVARLREDVDVCDHVPG